MKALIYIFSYPIILIISRLPFSVIYIISDIVCFILHKILGYRKDIVKSNLRLVFPKHSFSQLNKIKHKYPKIIKEIRGKGFLIGIQLHFNQSKFIYSLEKKNLLTIRAADNVIRVLPPLNAKKSEIDLALNIIKKVCKEYKL